MARKQKSNKIASKIPHWVEAFVVELSLQHPDFGARRLLPLLEQEGLTVSASAVYTILKRNNLQNRTLRLARLEEHRPAEIVPEPADTIEPPAKEPATVHANTVEKKPESPVSTTIKPPPKIRVRRPWSLSPFNILLLGLVGYFWVSAIGNLLNASRQSLPVASPPAADVFPKPKATVRPLEDYNIIIERNLFGATREQASAPQEELTLEGLPVSLKVLGLKLVGTVVGDDSAMSLAIIDDQSTRKQELYREGDQVGQALLKKILRNKVVLSTSSGDEVLTMEFEESGQSPRGSQWTAAGQVPERGPSANPAEREDQNSAFFDLDEFMQQVQISPYLQGEEPAGATITGNSKTLAGLRLRSGDVITGANGAAITSPEQVTQVFEKLAQGEEVTLDILRQNRPRKIPLR